MDKFIVPPKLNRKQLLFGFTVWEAGSIIAFIVLAIFAKVMFFATIAAGIAVLNFRPPEMTTGENKMNAREYIVLLFKYFRTYQVYSLRECDTENENKRHR